MHPEPLNLRLHHSPAPGHSPAAVKTRPLQAELQLPVLPVGVDKGEVRVLPLTVALGKSLPFLTSFSFLQNGQPKTFQQGYGEGSGVVCVKLLAQSTA